MSQKINIKKSSEENPEENNLELFELIRFHANLKNYNAIKILLDGL